MYFGDFQVDDTFFDPEEASPSTPPPRKEIPLVQNAMAMRAKCIRI